MECITCSQFQHNKITFELALKNIFYHQSLTNDKSQMKITHSTVGPFELIVLPMLSSLRITLNSVWSSTLPVHCVARHPPLSSTSPFPPSPALPLLPLFKIRLKQSLYNCAFFYLIPSLHTVRGFCLMGPRRNYREFFSLFWPPILIGTPLPYKLPPYPLPIMICIILTFFGPLLHLYCSETTLAGESRFHISTPQGIWNQVPCVRKLTGSPLDQWDMVRMKWDYRLYIHNMQLYPITNWSNNQRCGFTVIMCPEKKKNICICFCICPDRRYGTCLNCYILGHSWCWLRVFVRTVRVQLLYICTIGCWIRRQSYLSPPCGIRYI